MVAVVVRLADRLARVAPQVVLVLRPQSVAFVLLALLLQLDLLLLAHRWLLFDRLHAAAGHRQSTACLCLQIVGGAFTVVVLVVQLDTAIRVAVLAVFAGDLLGQRRGGQVRWCRRLVLELERR